MLSGPALNSINQHFWLFFKQNVLVTIAKVFKTKSSEKHPIEKHNSMAKLKFISLKNVQGHWLAVAEAYTFALKIRFCKSLLLGEIPSKSEAHCAQSASK